MQSFKLTVGNRSPSLRYTMKDPDGNPPDLTGKTVTFRMSSCLGPVAIDAGAVSVVTPEDGIVQHDWAAGETDTAGLFLAEFVVTDAQGRETAYPNGSDKIQVLISRGPA